MPTFNYTGVDKTGKKVQGKMDAPSESDLRILLRGMSVRPSTIQKAGALNQDLGSLFGGGGSGVPLQVLATFTRQMQVLISSGVPLVQALDILADQQTDKTMKNVLLATKDRVSSGNFFWESIAQYPRVFSKLYISLVRAGENSGSLDSVLKRLVRYLEDAEHISRLLKSAMMYPAIVVCIGIGVVAMMLIFVIPKFEEMLTQSGQVLPLPTQMVINASHFLAHSGHFILLGMGIVYYLLRRFLRTEEGRITKDKIGFKLPIFGNIAIKGSTARFSRTMQALLSSGVNLLDAVDICKQTIDNAVMEQAVSQIRAEIEQGKTLGAVLTKINIFPMMAVQMITIGESTGNLDKMLEKVADFYEAEVESLVNGLTKLLEPFILVFLGGTVGFILISMYLPIFKMAAGGAE